MIRSLAVAYSFHLYEVSGLDTLDQHVPSVKATKAKLLRKSWLFAIRQASRTAQAGEFA